MRVLLAVRLPPHVDNGDDFFTFARDCLSCCCNSSFFHIILHHTLTLARLFRTCGSGSHACDAGRYQQITFAESFNLINWTRPSPLNTSFFDIDTRYYKNPGRWDCIYSTPQDPSGPDGPRDGCVA
jgi:hypothetical protein